MRLFPRGIRRTPSRELTVIVTLAWWAAQPLLVQAYYSAQLARGAYAPDADTIAIPIFGTWALWAAASPLVLGLALWVGRRGAAGVPYLAPSLEWRPRGVITTALAAVASLLLIASAAQDARDGCPGLALAQVPGLLAVAWLRTAIVAAMPRLSPGGAAT